MYKKYINLAVAGAVTVSSLAVYAQTQPIAVTRAGVTGSILGAPGDYGVNTYDKNVLEQLIAKHLDKRQEQDAAFVRETVSKIELELKILVDEINKDDGLVKTSNKSVASGAANVELIDYLGLSEELIAKINTVDSTINGLFKIPSAIQSQQSMVIEGNERAILQPALRAELEEIEKFYQDQKAANLAQAERLTFNIKLPNGAPEVVKGFNRRPDKPMFSAQKTEEMRQAALEDTRIGEDVRLKLKELNLVTLADIRQIRRTFGTEQTYRFNLNKAGREVNFERIADIFLARNYLRAVYGTQLGVIGLRWEKIIANLDVIFKGNKSLLDPENIVGEFVVAEDDLIHFQDNIANAKYTAEMRNKEVFGKGVDFLDRVMSGYTFVVGQAQLGTVNALILELLLKDIEFELMLTKPGGLKAVRQAFREQYYQNADMEANVRAKTATYLTATAASDDIEQDVLAVNQEASFKGSLLIASQALEGVLDRAEQARTRLLAIEKLRSSSGENQRAIQRRKI